ncbi:MAG: LysR family transcriptional regulator [Lautropia sp.]
MMDLIQLRTFAVAAEEQHLTRAAERLHISQSAASAHVRALEESFGIRLFVRTPRGLELTDAGSHLLGEAKDLLHRAAAVAAHARQLGGQLGGALQVGCNSDPVLSRVAGIVQALREHAPGIHLALYARTSMATREGVRNGELDAGLLIGRPSDDRDAGLDYLVLRSLRYRIAGPAAWRERIEAADWPALAALPWITPIGNALAYARMLDALFTERGLQRNTVVETDNDLLQRTLVAGGAGLSLMREDHALAGVAAGTMALSPIGEAASNLLLAYPAARRGDPLLSALVAAVRMVWPQAQGPAKTSPAD